MKNIKDIKEDIPRLKKVVSKIKLKRCPNCGNEAGWAFEPFYGGQWTDEGGNIMAHRGCKTFKCMQVMPQQLGLDSQLFEMAKIWNNRISKSAVKKNIKLKKYDGFYMPVEW